MKCQICGNEDSRLIKTKCGIGTSMMCPTCSAQTPREHYYTILSRIDASTKIAEGLLRDAKKAGDEQTAWFAQKVIEQNAKARNNLAVPEGVG